MRSVVMNLYLVIQYPTHLRLLSALSTSIFKAEIHMGNWSQNCRKNSYGTEWVILDRIYWKKYAIVLKCSLALLWGLRIKRLMKSAFMLYSQWLLWWCLIDSPRTIKVKGSALLVLHIDFFWLESLKQSSFSSGIIIKCLLCFCDYQFPPIFRKI